MVGNVIVLIDDAVERRWILGRMVFGFGDGFQIKIEKMVNLCIKLTEKQWE